MVSSIKFISDRTTEIRPLHVSLPHRANYWVGRATPLFRIDNRGLNPLTQDPDNTTAHN